MKILRSVHTALIEHAIRELPNEACGFVLGFHLAPTVVHGYDIQAAKNVASHPDHTFQISGREWFDIGYQVGRGEGSDIVGLYHSHPRGPSTLSDVDMAGAREHPDLLHLLISLHELKWPPGTKWPSGVKNYEAYEDLRMIHREVRAFRIGSGIAEEEELEVVE